VEPSPPRRRPSLRVWALAGLAIILACIPAVWHAVENRRRLNEALQASMTQGSVHQSLSGITSLRVWGAGIRTVDEKFCGCAIVPKPERIYYETKDQTEIRDFIGLLRVRPYWTLEPPVSTCGQITIDFLRDGKRVFWLHLRGQDLPSRIGPIPVTSGTVDDIEAWLKQRSVRERMQADFFH
jgi:hypothetical protein